jgi:hypothetical protein
LNGIGFTQRNSLSVISEGFTIHTFTSTKISLHNNPVLSVHESNSNPINFSLEQNYPNPFNPSTTIQYVLSSSSYITLRLYDLLGREIKILDDGFRSKGQHSISFHADNLTSGTYFYRLNANGYVETKKILLLK